MMANFFKKLSACILFFVLCTILSAQEKQYTLNKDKSKVSLNIDLTKANFTVDNLLRKRMGQPLLEAKNYTLDINADTVGIWTESPSGKDSIWILSVEVPDAKAFYIELDEFYLPQGTQLFVYNKSNTRESTVFKNEDNPRGGPYSLENLKGDNVILEYVANKSITEKPKIHFSDIGCKYSDETGNIAQFGSSASCMININCDEGQSWQVQKKGVVQLRIKRTEGNNNLCTGTLINNTNNDKTPYVLTASHCLESVDPSDPDNFAVFFDYESPTCENGTTSPPYKYHRGAEVKVQIPLSGGSDGTLLQLSENIPDDWDVYFNGWDRNNTASSITSGAVIHHPEGDVKKITLYGQSPQSGRWDSSSPSGSFWITSYIEGATQGGSSGCPMFNQNGLVIGTLTGGNNSCTNNTATDYYGKLWYHWDQNSDENQQMSKYLDPNSTEQTILAGLYNNENLDRELVLDKSSIEILLHTSATINIISGNGDYVITSSNPAVATADISGNVISIKADALGLTTFTVTDNKDKSFDIQVYVRKDIDITIDSNKQLKVSVYEDNSEDDSDKIKEVRVINYDADVLYSKKNINENSHSIDMTVYKKGIYIIQVKTQRGTTKAERILWQN